MFMKNGRSTFDLTGSPKASPVEGRVERSRYAEKTPICCLRIILHVGSFVLMGPILQHFVRTNQHDERFPRAFCPAVRQPLETPEAEGPATQDH
ncbi:MAG: hypothetical protein KBH41_01400, partial [Azonexus sp.]|nr:hypothetical protein [Azonexus sp.]